MNRFVMSLLGGVGFYLVVFLSLPVEVFAYSSSANAALSVDVFSGAGNTSTSEKEVLSSSLGQSTPVGESTSANYFLQGGFWFAVVQVMDTDGDGTPNMADSDDDNDGLNDAEEAALGTNPLSSDTDGDGLSDRLEVYTLGSNPISADTDGDRISDMFETNGGTAVDSDNDGIPDFDDLDADNDGIPDSHETIDDADGDGIPNYLDLDADGDGLADVIEGESDYDSDGLGNFVDLDADGDGLTDMSEGGRDVDGDGMPNYLDLDADGDGFEDAAEVVAGTDPYLTDTDGDGAIDSVDPYPLVASNWSGPPVSAGAASFYGNVTIDGVAAEPGDEIAVFDSDNILCGHAYVESGGLYANLYVAGDDPGTLEDEGAVPGELLVFRVWDTSGGQELRTTLNIVAGPDPVTYQEGTTSQVDLVSKGNNELIFPLPAGWNLVSFPIARAWYTAEPPAGLPEGFDPQQVTSIGDIFSSIAGKYQLVRSFDNSGAHTYDPSLPDFFNDLTYVAGGYGYWLKMTEPAELVLEGPPMLSSDGLQLQAGWNLVGYWEDDVKYVGSEPTYPYPNGATYTPVVSISEILNSLGSKLLLVRSFDSQGAHTYDPSLPDFFNDLTYMGPGYSYWIKVSEDVVLYY